MFRIKELKKKLLSSNKMSNSYWIQEKPNRKERFPLIQYQKYSRKTEKSSSFIELKTD